ATLIRPAPASERITFQVYLGLRNTDAAERLAYDVSDPTSPSYRGFLSPESFRARFSPSATAIRAVESWLRSGGFSVDDVPENRTFVEASGSVAQAERAFAVPLNEYRVRRSVLRAPAAAPEIPAALATHVIGVSLEESERHPALNPSAAPPAAAQVGHPCSKYWGEQRA